METVEIKPLPGTEDTSGSPEALARTLGDVRRILEAARTDASARRLRDAIQCALYYTEVAQRQAARLGREAAESREEEGR